MKKKVTKKARSAKNTTSKKRRSLFANIAIGKFRFASAIVLGCLLLLAGGVFAYTKVIHTSVLGTKTAKVECIAIASNTDPSKACVFGTGSTGGIYTDRTRCVPYKNSDNSLSYVSFNACQAILHKRPIYVRILGTDKKPLNKYSSVWVNPGVGIKVSMSVVELPNDHQTHSPTETGSDGIMVFSQYFSPETTAPGNQVTFTISTTRSGIYTFDKTSLQTVVGISGGSYCGASKEDACTFILKSIKYPSPSQSSEKAPRCGYKSVGTCTVSHVCGSNQKEISGSCSSPFRVCCEPKPKAQVKPKKAPVKATCSSKGGYCTTAVSCKRAGGLQVSAPGCSYGQVCCD